MPQHAAAGDFGDCWWGFPKHATACHSMPQHAAANFFLKIPLMLLLLPMLLLMLMLLEEFQRVSQLLFPIGGPNGWCIKRQPWKNGKRGMVS